jgi:hypothetical protein
VAFPQDPLFFGDHKGEIPVDSLIGLGRIHRIRTACKYHAISGDAALEFCDSRLASHKKAHSVVAQIVLVKWIEHD